MQCHKCLGEFDESAFYNDKSKKSGKRPRCKECEKKSINKENRKEYEKKYWDARREERRLIVRMSHNKNSSHHKEVRKKYLKTEGGIEMYRRQTQRRYALKKRAFVEDVNPKEVFKLQDGICYLCNGRFSFEEMELDHAIPLSRGGKHCHSNCKMACRKCNRSKGAKLPEEMIYQMV